MSWLDDVALTRALERGELPDGGFPHASHLRVALVYLRESATVDEAIGRMAATLRRVAAAVGHPEKFSQPTTEFWMYQMAAARALLPDGDGDALLAAFPRLLDKNLMRAAYRGAMAVTLSAPRPLRLIPPIHRATHRIGLYLAALRGHGLSQGEAHILALLAMSSPATIAELQHGLAHKRSTLTSILDRLTARGFITREVGAADRRTFVITLTVAGRRVARQVYRHLMDLEAAVVRGLTPGDLRGFMKVVAAVEEEAHRRTR